MLAVPWIFTVLTLLLCADARIICPDPTGFKDGEVKPRLGEYYEGSNTSYSCFEGYTLRGSPTRTCQPNGKWSGETPICDNGSDYCPNPGTPPGCHRNGERFGIDDKVTYQCDTGLFMFGSTERVCQDNHEWTGTEPACYYKNTYDTPEEAVRGFVASIDALLRVEESDAPPIKENLARKLNITKGGKLHIYIILDASESVGEEDFEKSKKCALNFMEKIHSLTNDPSTVGFLSRKCDSNFNGSQVEANGKISSYEVEPKWGILSFARKTKKIVDIVDEKIRAAQAYSQLSDFDYTKHDLQYGTNIKGALDSVYKDMSFLKARNRKEFEEARNVILLITDGKSNMGGNPQLVVRKIRSLIGITHPGHDKEEFLDIYVFGVGKDIDEDEINLIASKKDKEKHVFKLKDPEELAETFEQMIVVDDSVGLCGLYREEDNMKVTREKYPWQVSIESTHPDVKQITKCEGAIVSNRHVLTSAHCFVLNQNLTDVKVIINPTQEKKVEFLFSHPDYNIYGKNESQKIKEFYDYDIAIIQLKEDIIYKKETRPICIPCTEEASGALRLDKKTTTCKQHRDILLPDRTNVDASFLSKAEKKNVKIKLGTLKEQCYEDALKAPIYKDVPGIDWPDVVTDRFLCTGGTDPVIDDVTCKGDSGGSLFLEKKRRMFQVGVISWGNKNHCVGGSRQPTENDSRDYHINLFEVQDFLKRKLGNDLQFIN